MVESSGAIGQQSNFRGGKSATKYLRPDEERISFRDLAKLAWRRKPWVPLAERTGKDQRTVKRWLSRGSRAPDLALAVVWSEIMRRYG
jgi:hypothetical protein